MKFVDLTGVMPELEAKAKEIVDLADEATAECHPLRTMVLTEALCESLDRLIKADGLDAGNATVLTIVRMINSRMTRCFEEVLEASK